MRILATSMIASEAVALLEREHEVTTKELTQEVLLASIEYYDALIVRSGTFVTKEIIEKGSRLKVIAVASVGVDKIDVAQATRRGVVVVNAPHGSTYSAAELAIGLIISIARHIPKADRTMKDGLWEKKRLKGAELHGKVLGLIGSGRIGTEVARRAMAFGMKVLAYDPYIPPEILILRGINPVDMDELLARSDFVTLHTILTPETRGMMNLDMFRKMKRSAYLINASRGPIINERDLVEALNQKLIAGAALDVYETEPPADSPLLKMENVVLTPHLGASTKEGQERVGLIVSNDVLKVLDGEKAENIVNKELYS